ncbi:MAG: hypothetical protein ROO71_11505 [Balneola sp.]
MTKIKQALLTIILLMLATPVVAQNDYQVTLLRAAPGELGNLIEYVKKQKSDSDGSMMIMRHSQGDHWDLMLLTPFSKPEMHDYSEWVDFQHDFLAESDVSWKELMQKDAEAGLYHIEMFNAAHGLHDELLEQRAMENIYYNETNRDGNVIFVTKFGSDVDNFTLGFYKDMIDFATDPDLTDKQFEDAALKAGFESRSTIGLYLRQFLVGHNDTIATKVN